MEIVSVKIGSPSQATKVNIEAPEQVKVTFKDVVVNNGGGSVRSVNGQTGDVLLDAAAVGALPNTTKIPANTSDLINNSGFITKTVSDLTNYYLKSETYSREEINNKISATKVTSENIEKALGYTPAKQDDVTGLSDDIDMLIDSHVLNGEEKTLTVGVDIQVGQVIDFHYLTEDGYTIKRTESILGTFTQTQVEGVTANGYAKNSMTVGDVESYTFIGVYADISAEVPTKVSELENDAGYVTDAELEQKGYALQTTVDGLSEEIADLKESISNGGDICPYEEVSSIEEMTDTSKTYLMNGYLYSYKSTDGIEMPDFTNKANPSDSNWKADTRINSSGAEASATNGLHTTNYIAIAEGDTVRIKNATLFGSAKAQAKVAYYSTADGTASDSGMFVPNSYTSHFTSENGVESFVAWALSSAGFEGSYMRLSIEPTGDVDDIIITVNEEITYSTQGGTMAWVKGAKYTPTGSSTGGSTSSGTVTEEVAVPEYWKAHLETKIATVQALQDTVGDDLVSFPVFADLHCNANPSYNLGRNIGLLTREVMDSCNIPFAVNAGDTNSSGNLSSKDAVESCIENAMDIFEPIKDGLLLARGNHDITYGGTSADGNTYRWQYSPSELYNKLFRWQATDFRRVFDPDSDGTYFYVDDKAHKTRFIVLDSQWVEWQGRNEDGSVIYNAHHNSGYGQRQLDWLANVALQFNEAGWDAVIVTHVPPTSITYNGTTRNYLSETRDGVIFKEIVRAFCDKETYAGTYTGTDAWQNVNVDFDFTSRNGNVACILSGHCHVDRIITDELPCPIITITCASNIPRTGEETETRVFGTITETAFDIVSIDKANHKIYMTRVGIGSDRECSYRAEVLPNILLPPTTIDFAEHDGDYLQEGTPFMLDPTKSYKVIWDGMEYIVDTVFGIADGSTASYLVGNPGMVGLSDNGLPFIILTQDEGDGVTFIEVIDWLYISGQIDNAPSRTFSVIEVVGKDEPLVYKCTMEPDRLVEGDVEMEGIFLKGISPALFNIKQRTIELNGHLYTSSCTTFNDAPVVSLTRLYMSSIGALSMETINFFNYGIALMYNTKVVANISMNNVEVEGMD